MPPTSDESRLDSLRSTKIYRYSLPSESFVAWEASGQWVSDTAVEPLVVLAIGDLLSIHAAARVELRIVADLWPLHDLAVSGGWDFSVVRRTNAVPR